MTGGLFLPIFLTAIGFLGLVGSVVGLVGMFSGSTVCRVPLAAVSEVKFDRTGEYVLRFEVPKNSSLIGENFNYELLNRQRGNQPVELKPSPNPLTVKFNQKRSFPVRLFNITETETYTLKISGIEPPMEYLQYYPVVSKLHLWKAFLYVVGIIFTALMFAGGLVLTISALNANK
jgi:hypothetical protein